MGNALAMTGVTGKKSGGVFADHISKNLDEIRSRFPGGIRALVRETSDVTRLKKAIPSVELCTGALDDVEYLKKCFQNVDTIVHIAGMRCSVPIVEAAAFCNVRRLILVHTTGIYSKYKAASKDYQKIEEQVYDICKKNNIRLTICRPTMIYGNVYDDNVVTFIKMVDKFPIMPVVNGARYELQPVHYKDLGKAYFDILINEEATSDHDYNLSGGAPIMLRDMLSVIGENLGKKTKFISCPFPIAYAGSWVVYGVTIGKMDLREKVQRLCESRTFTHEEAAKDFGFKPVTFRDGVVDEVKEYMALNKREF